MDFKQLNWWRVALVILILLGVYLRLTNLEGKVYWIDEVHTSLRAAGYIEPHFIQETPLGEVLNLDFLQSYQQLDSETSLWRSVKTIASSEHSPLYYFLTRLSMDGLGSSIIVTRGLAAVLSLFSLPAIYALSLELFASTLVAEISLALVAISPFHIIYAQEAREYSLLTVAIILASVSFLWAMRDQNRSSWLTYSGTVAFGLYVHPLVGLVSLGHGIYALFSQKWQLNQVVFRYALYALLGLVLFIPWILVFIFNEDGMAGWVTKETPFYILLQRWLINAVGSVYDLQMGYQEQLFDIQAFQDISLSSHQLGVYLLGIVLLFIIYSFYVLYRYGTEKQWWFIITLVGATGLALAVPDLVTGGQRSTIGRYAIACHLGVQLTLAYCLGHHLKSAIPFNSQRVWRFILTATLTLSLISSIVMHKASTWWNKYSSYYNPEVADQINQSDRAIVLSSVPRIIRPTSLSHHLKPETKFIFFDEEISIAFPEEATDVYVFRPLANLLEGLESNNYSVTVLHEKGKLWKVNL
jgi:uncharacterized membrane protein